MRTRCSLFCIGVLQCSGNSGRIQLVRNTPPAFCISVQNIFSASHCIVDIVYLVFHVSSQRRPSVGTGVNRHRIGNPSCLALPQRYLAIKMPPEMQVASWMDVRAASGSLDNYWVVGWSLFSACHPHFDCFLQVLPVPRLILQTPSIFL